MGLSLQDKVYYLEQIVVHNCPISRIALGSQWNLQMVESIYNIFDHYSKKINSGDYNFTYATIEEDFNKIGIDQVNLKSIIIAFGEAGKYENVIKHYLQTNNKAFGNVSLEFLGLYRKYF